MNVGVISYLLRHLGTAEAMDFLSSIGYQYTELDYRHADGLTDYHKVDAQGAAKTRQLCIELALRRWPTESAAWAKTGITTTRRMSSSAPRGWRCP